MFAVNVVEKTGTIGRGFAAGGALVTNVILGVKVPHISAHIVLQSNDFSAWLAKVTALDLVNVSRNKFFLGF